VIPEMPKRTGVIESRDETIRLGPADDLRSVRKWRPHQAREPRRPAFLVSGLVSSNRQGSRNNHFLRWLYYHCSIRPSFARGYFSIMGLTPLRVGLAGQGSGSIRCTSGSSSPLANRGEPWYCVSVTERRLRKPSSRKRGSQPNRCSAAMCGTVRTSRRSLHEV
jgi:hypothetical protein